MQEDYITADHLKAVGINVDEAKEIELLEHLNNQLLERVGADITESLNDEELEELVTLQETADEEAVGTWIQNHVSELPKIVDDQRDILLGEIAENADGLAAT